MGRIGRKKKVKLEKNQRLLFRSIEKPTHCPLLSFSFLPPPRTPATRARPKGGCELAGCIAGTERGKDVGPGGSAAPRAAAEVVGPLALHTPLSNSSEAHAWDSSSPSFLDRLPGWGAPRFFGSRGSWGVRRDFYTLPFHRCVTPLPLRLMLLLFPNAYATVFELRRSHDLE